ncbi:MAG: 50S ribosomal protein L11 methyltransferase [Solirubrobacteraceae bacterium]
MIRLALRVPAEHADVVLAELLELAPAGVEESRLDGGVEYAVYGAPGELPELPDLQAAVGGVPIEVSTTEVADDWSERWKQFHRPVLVAPPAEAGHNGQARLPALHVRPPWLPASEVQGAQEIVIDPGQAFGTGAHATTHLCLELLLAVAHADPARGAVLDVGAGSGVLGIAAAKLGYAPVLGLDNDRESIAAIAGNAAVNGVEMEARRFDLRRESLPGGSPLMLANLLRPLLLSLASSMTRPPRHVIASGLLRAEADEVAAAFAERLSLRERERRERGDWAALWLAPG